MLTQHRGDSHDPILVRSQSQAHHAPSSAKQSVDRTNVRAHIPSTDHNDRALASSSVEQNHLHSLDLDNPASIPAVDLAAPTASVPPAQLNLANSALAPPAVTAVPPKHVGQLGASVRAAGGNQPYLHTTASGSLAIQPTIKVVKGTTRLVDIPPDAVLALAAEQAAIARAQSNIKAITKQHALTFRVKRPDNPSRADEKEIARITGDHELLQHGSTKIKEEACSEDDEADVLRELDPQLAAKRLFNPKAKINMRSADGYVINAFVVDDGASDHGVDGGLARSQDSTERDSSDDSNIDDDSDSDYIPSETSTPSASKKRSVRISQSDMAAFQAFKAQQQAHAGAKSPSHSPKHVHGSPRARGGGSPRPPTIGATPRPKTR